MRKVVQMVASIVLSVALCTGIPEINCLAAETIEDTGAGEDAEILESVVLEDVTCPSEIMPYTMLAQCIISISGSDEGMLINISTGTVGTASVLGIKDIKIQKKVWYGWKTVATSSGGESKNHSMMGVSILYANAIKDETYRITCVHYGDVDGYTEGTNDTDAFVYTY